MNQVKIFAPRELGRPCEPLKVEWLSNLGNFVAEGAPVVKLSGRNVWQIVYAPTGGRLDQFYKTGERCARGACIGTIAPA